MSSFRIDNKILYAMIYTYIYAIIRFAPSQKYQEVETGNFRTQNIVS